MGVTITERDRGYAALVARVFDLAKENPKIHVGVLEADAEKSHGGGDDALTVIQVAVINEFGSDDGEHPPSRSFIRAWFDEEESHLREKLTLLMQSVIARRRTPDQIIELMGQYCVGQIQKRIAEGIEPENKQSTIDQKGSSTPLIGKTGVLRASISYRVEK